MDAGRERSVGKYTEGQERGNEERGLSDVFHVKQPTHRVHSQAARRANRGGGRNFRQPHHHAIL